MSGLSSIYTKVKTANDRFPKFKKNILCGIKSDVLTFAINNPTTLIAMGKLLID